VGEKWNLEKGLNSGDGLYVVMESFFKGETNISSTYKCEEIMKFLNIALLMSVCLIPSMAQSGNGTSFERSLDQLLANYSKLSGTKFVIDPSVKGEAIIDGIGEADIEPRLLVSILEVHGYSAIKKSGMVYVLPNSKEAGMLEDGGTRWATD